MKPYTGKIESSWLPFKGKETSTHPKEDGLQTVVQFQRQDGVIILYRAVWRKGQYNQLGQWSALINFKPLLNRPARIEERSFLPEAGKVVSYLVTFLPWPLESDPKQPNSPAEVFAGEHQPNPRAKE